MAATATNAVLSGMDSTAVALVLLNKVLENANIVATLVHLSIRRRGCLGTQYRVDACAPQLMASGRSRGCLCIIIRKVPAKLSMALVVITRILDLLLLLLLLHVHHVHLLFG